MFILYALPVGLVVGLLTGGHLHGLGEARLRWAPFALLGLLIQVVLFFGPVAESVGWVGMPIYVGSTALVLIVVLRNARMPGLPVVALGALSNMTAIIANGGYMPASREALTILGGGLNPGYSNSALIDHPAVAPLTDIFALPPNVPFANVFSVGDVLIGVGVAWAIVALMHGVYVNRLAILADGWPAARSGETGPDPASAPPAGDGLLIGRLDPVSASTVWKDDLSLAVWLHGHLDLLAARLGQELRNPQLIESERPVIVAESAGTTVVIVCELGESSDEGFGCLVRHLAAVGATSAIWISGKPSDVHVESLSFTNRVSGTPFSLALLGLVRIGSSLPAPILELVVRPDDPGKVILPASDMAGGNGSSHAARRPRAAA
ncbi:MAG TPA: DUF5317 domain-containing protein [Candidatus Limnocylindrales bacterium]|nr:DUF5317 domain-containing protein [Candidatus Limnocylindrales bacterium]